jgi:hypothetical protein
MPRLKYYNPTTEQWENVVVGGQGEQGDVGPANTLTVGTVDDSAPGSTPEVTITGTAPNQTINFVLPTGADGADSTVPGPQGDPGEQGDPGPGVAPGGTVGQILTKDSSDDYDTSWQDLPESSGVVSSATAPENTNSIWFNTENGNTYIYYDNFWTSIAGSSGAPIISDTAPTSPVLGMQWFNSSNGKSYLYYSNAWVEMDSNGTNIPAFENATVRTAAIPTPTEGMYSHLNDTDRLQFWNGSAWRSPFGNTLISRTAFSAQTVVNFNDVFTSEFDNYEIFVSVSGTAGAGISFQFRSGTTNLSTSTYFHNNAFIFDTAASGQGSANNTSFPVAVTRATGLRTFAKLVVANPARSGVNKNYLYQSFDWTGGALASYIGGGMNSTTTVQDGFVMSVGSGNMTGEVTIYGMRI